MAKFEIDGIQLRIPGRSLRPALIKSLENGLYEWNEAKALKKNLKPGDRLLELGAGAGYLSSLAARVIGAENVVAVEASPDMLEVLEWNLKLNDARDVRIVHGAVMPESHTADTVSFSVHRAFWSSRVVEGKPPEGARVETVPALQLPALLDEVQPTVVMMDVEGAEIDLCQKPWPDCVRLVMMEIHPARYPQTELQRLFDGMSRNGFTYMPWGTRGAVVVFQRIVPGAVTEER